MAALCLAMSNKSRQLRNEKSSFWAKIIVHRNVLSSSLFCQNFCNSIRQKFLNSTGPSVWSEMEEVSTVLLWPTFHTSDWLVDPITSVDRFRILDDFLRGWYRFLPWIKLGLRIPSLGSKWTSSLRTTVLKRSRRNHQSNLVVTYLTC